MDSLPQSNKSIEYLKEIERNIVLLKENTLANCNVVSDQSDKIKCMDKNAEQLNYNIKVGKWYLNLIDSTFGKVYEKFNNLPKLPSYKKTTNKKPTNLKIFYNFTKQQTNKIEQDTEFNNTLERISNNLSDLKDIHTEMGNEIKYQNEMLDEIDDITENNQGIVYSNIIKVKKIIRKL